MCTRVWGCGGVCVCVCVRLCVCAQRAGSCEMPRPVSCETGQKPGRAGGDVTARAAPRASRTGFSSSQGCHMLGSVVQHAITTALGTVTAASGLPVTFLTQPQPFLFPIFHRWGPPGFLSSVLSPPQRPWWEPRSPLRPKKCLKTSVSARLGPPAPPSSPAVPPHPVILGRGRG